MRKEEAAVICLLSFVAMLLIMCIVSFIEAKRQVAEINKFSVERCMLISCDIGLFGDLHCTTLESVTNITDVAGHVFLNFTGRRGDSEGNRLENGSSDIQDAG